MRLPEAFENRMREQLGEEEFLRYRACFDRRVSSALRVNTLKLSPEEFVKLSDFSLRNVPWIKNGFYYGAEDMPSKHPYYYAGLYYLQEPSAMTPANLLPIEVGDRVLDLCAAPGGKSTELAAKLKGTGVLVANDISATRAKALLKNLELFGATNIVVTSEPANKLAERFPMYFDKILVDAPCSGEGMFRKQPEIMKNWEQYGTGYYNKLQKEILPQAIAMLKPGGQLLYSTCTFAPLEDEETVAWVLRSFPEMELLEAIPEGRKADYESYGFLKGRPEWMEEPDENLTKCVRLFPHRLEGEGHFLARFKKREDAYDETIYAPRTVRSERTRGRKNARRGPQRPTSTKTPEAVSDWLATLSPEGRKRIPAERIRVTAERVNLLPEEMPDVAGLRVLREGWLLGELKKEHFAPSQACAMGLRASEFPNVCSLVADDPNVVKYLKCETINPDIPIADGDVLVCVDGHPLGFAKVKGESFKNRYLPGWRMM
ncbi:MAG: RsmB/NOP family class I SAM-dependent RNA methyltransferase [Lachnospiraceae bacterium]|nr:RsmB/NOP family class I SAM-dependent RNA methyltransferase [Lachnospiraceae bacterium]